MFLYSNLNLLLFLLLLLWPKKMKQRKIFSCTLPLRFVLLSLLAAYCLLLFSSPSSSLIYYTAAAETSTSAYFPTTLEQRHQQQTTTFNNTCSQFSNCTLCTAPINNNQCGTFCLLIMCLIAKKAREFCF